MGRRSSKPIHRGLAGLGAIALGCFALANCTTGGRQSNRVDPHLGVAASPRVIEPGQPIPKGGGTYRIGNPYFVAGRMYVPEENRRYRAEGIASWYGDDFHGRLTANGEIYDMEAISAAHATMPIPSYARVTNSGNGRSLIVRVNDRGPYHPGRIIDLSSRAAEMLDVRRAGTALVRVEYVGPAPLEGSDDRKLIATLREGMPAPTPSNVMLASAKPFVPEITTTTPSRRTAAAGLSAPLDPDHRERAEDIVASRSGPWANSDRSAGLREISATTRPVASASGSAPRSHGSVPVSAYAPGQYDGGTGVTTGRGLY